MTKRTHSRRKSRDRGPFTPSGGFAVMRRATAACEARSRVMLSGVEV